MNEPTRTKNSNRISKLLTGFLLVFVFEAVVFIPFSGSVVGLSPIPTAWAISKGCDKDGDGYIKNSTTCINKYESEPIDCDDSDSSIHDEPCGPTDPTDPTDPTTLTPCPANFMCLASVDKWDRPAARYYVEDTFPIISEGQDTINGSFTKIPPNVFGNILAALPEVEDFDELCAAYDVLIFQWKSPGIKNLTWQSLVNYMACGGGVVFEDPSNVDALEEFDENGDNIGVATTNIYIRSNSTPPITIAFDSGCSAAFPALTLCGPWLSPDITNVFNVENNHMEFAITQDSEEPKLFPFLRLLPDEQIIGLYGKHSGGGRIVITGPDNSFHGNDSLWVYDPLKEAHYNQYHLLSREIDWLLLGGPAE